MSVFGVRIHTHKALIPLCPGPALLLRRSMAQKHSKSGIPHEDRTAAEPRDENMHDVTLHKIQDVNESIKLYKLRIQDAKHGVKFRPGQWLDVFIPTMPKAGGFTITSTPSQALPSSGSKHPYLELAVQRSPDSPPAAWLWQKPSNIIGSALKVRVGGSFTWPPHGWTSDQISKIDKVIFVAGGVGINPQISMISSMFEKHSQIPRPPKISFLYSTKLPSSSSSGADILFLPRLLEIADRHPKEFDLTTFLTTVAGGTKLEQPESLGWFHDRRITEADLKAVLGEPSERERMVVYTCGPPRMTDDLVAWFGSQPGMDPSRVFCEKWW